jgi:chemotaxis protein methyltransferase CheR
MAATNRVMRSDFDSQPHVATYGSKVIHLPHRVVEIASGADIAARMMRSERMMRPVAMHRVVAEAMTIRETSFFRDHLPWEILAERLLPELIWKRKKQRKLRLWSAGCATGQEAYSLAMMICDRFPELSEWDVQIVGTDISHTACAYARRGKFSRLEINRGLPARLMLRYFERGGDEWSVRPEVKRMVRFEQGDLRQAPLVRTRGFDMVLLRNVLPYFEASERRKVMAETYSRLADDAVMLVGTAEQIEDAPELFGLDYAKDQQFYRVVTTA